jgi:hypothetical protein
MSRELQVGLLMAAAAALGFVAEPARALDEVGAGQGGHHGGTHHGPVIEYRETHGQHGEASHREEHHEVVRKRRPHGEERH